MLAWYIMRLTGHDETGECDIMRSIAFSIALTVAVLTSPVLAARQPIVPVRHSVMPVFPAWFGMDPTGTAKAAPGVLTIVPGNKWSNFVSAYGAGIPYSVKQITLKASIPTDFFGSLHRTITQSGEPNVRLHWPLMFNYIDGAWTLSVYYATQKAWDDDGPGPNPASTMHVEEWQWRLDATLESLSALLDVYHDVPCGASHLPIISDEVVYSRLRSMLDEAIRLQNGGDTAGMGLALGDFELLVGDAAIASCPSLSPEAGPGQGIVETDDYPAVTTLMSQLTRVSCRYSYGCGDL